MKCSKCETVGADTDKTCFKCGASLSAGFSAGGNTIAMRIATACACLGACIFPMVMDSYKPIKRTRGINWEQVTYAGMGGAIGGTLGMVGGSLIFRKREY
jgi:hypothetical protein